MEKQVVKFKRTDGKTPAATPWGANLRLPFSVNVPAADKDQPARIRIALGLTCDKALLVWADRNIGALGLELLEPLSIAEADSALHVVLVNRQQRPVTLEEGTSVLRVAFLGDDRQITVE